MAILRGNKIRERRHALGITQEDLAKAVKVSIGSINRFEHNKGANELAAGQTECGSFWY